MSIIVEIVNVLLIVECTESHHYNLQFVPEGLQYGAGEEAALAVIQAFDRLAKQLRELPDLPLEVAGVQGLSAVCRGAEVFPPLARTGRPQAKAGMEGPTCWLLNTKLGKAPEYIDQIEGEYLSFILNNVLY